MIDNYIGQNDCNVSVFTFNIILMKNIFAKKQLRLCIDGFKTLS